MRKQIFGVFIGIFLSAIAGSVWSAGMVVTDPADRAGRAQWQEGKTVSIKWTGVRCKGKGCKAKKAGYGGKNVKIQLFFKGAYHSTLTSSTKNDGLWRYTVADMGGKVGHKQFQIRVAPTNKYSKKSRAGRSIKFTIVE